MLNSLSHTQKNHVIAFMYLLLLGLANVLFYTSATILNNEFNIPLPFDMNQTIKFEDPAKHQNLITVKYILWLVINIITLYLLFNLLRKSKFENNIEKKQIEIEKQREELNKLHIKTELYKETLNRGKVIIKDEDVLQSKTLHPKITNLFEQTLLEDTTLDYIAFFQQHSNKKVIYIENVTENFTERLEEHKINKTAVQQVEKYRMVAISLRDTIDFLNNQFSVLDQNILIRTVFDVEKGGIFYYHFNDDEFLFGATINQKHMNDDTADTQMRLLYDEILDIKTNRFNYNA